MSATIQDVLANAGISFRPGGWLRLKGPGLDAISVNAESGGWRDHRSGEHGNFSALCSKLGIDDCGIVISGSTQANGTENEESSDWARAAWGRGIPAVPPKRPSGWAASSWDNWQEQFADHREAVYDYLASRGLDPLPLLPLIRIQPQLNPRTKPDGTPNVDAEMADAGSDFAFLIPMYQIGKREIPKNLCGVQRTFLKFGEDKYSRTQKIGRAMLGKKGVTTLAPSGSPVILPVAEPAIGSGEGFETVASFVQIMRRPGVVCWDWSGLKVWSESLNPGEDAPWVAFLVDYDTSQTGQRESAAAVRRIMAHPHGKAVYLLPPESITPDAKGNRDWNDLLRQSPKSFAAEIIHAWHKADENMALAPIVEVSPLSTIKTPTDAEAGETIADAVEQHFAYQQAEKAVKAYLPRYLELREELAKWQEIPLEERKARKLKRPKLAPLLIKVTPGVGKSHLIREILQSFEDVPLLILTRSHELADAYGEAGAFHYYGRAEAPEEPKGASYKGEEVRKFPGNTCLNFQTIKITTDNNHIPALTACRNCEYGRKFIIATYHKDSQPYKEAMAWLLENGFTDRQIRDIPACMWLGHQADAGDARVVVAPNASYSETLATWNTRGEDGKAANKPRLVIVDETPDLTRHLTANSENLGLHAQKCMQMIARLERSPLKSGIVEVDQTQQQLLADLKDALDKLRQLARVAGNSVGTKEVQRLPESLVGELKELHVKWLPGATALWEKAEIKYGHEPIVPLRVLHAVMRSVATNTVIIRDGQIHANEITPLGERIKDGLPSIVLDATPSPTVEYLVNRKGGQVIAAIAKQHVNISHFNQFLHGRTWKNKAHQQEELEALLTLKQAQEETTGKVPVVLTYMPHCELAAKDEDPDWGYFGRDDIGQDRWNGRDMLIFGGPILSPLAQEIMYNADLMLLRLAGDTDMPDWSQEIERNAKVVVGKKVIISKAPLPVDSVLRQWVLNGYARRMVQAIGRPRAVWATEPINIWIVGGLPLAGLAAYGLEVSEYREEKRNKNDTKSKIALERVQGAVASLQSADQDPSYRAVNEWFEQHSMPEVRYNAWKKVMQQSVYDLDRDTYRVVDALLKALQSVVDSAKICGCDPADIARDRIADGVSLPPVQRAASALVLEGSPEYAGDWPSPENVPPS